MTQDEIIEMARQAGLPEAIIEMTPIAFERFAKLVAEKEREAWSKVCEDIRKVFNEKADLAYIAGQKEEREACAAICDELHKARVGKDNYFAFAANAIRELRAKQ
jgi:hypothetical protein